MNFIEFLSILNDKTGSRKLPPVFCFVGKKYPALFMYHIKEVYKRKLYILQSLDCENIIVDSGYKSHLEMSFLGSHFFYWLNNFSFLDSKQQTALQQYLEQYQGPHTLHFFSDKSLFVKIPAIELPHECDFELYVQLFNLFFPEYVQKMKSPLLLSFFKKYRVVSLENACLLMNYCLVLGSKNDYAVEELFDALIVPEKSLFMLSAHFFAKQDQEFFTLWHLIKNDYGDVFWTTYWSEQLFRAYCFIELMQKKDFAQAKKSAFRLPFSFVQKDWKSIALVSLKNAHNQITIIDWNIKNGISSYFEHFFLNFFQS